MKKYDFIILDLGGVIYDIDYQNTTKALGQLFDKNLDDFFSKKEQWETVDLFEEGKISPQEFCDSIRATLGNNTPSNEAIRKAWDAILIGFREQTVVFLEELGKRIPLFLYSNTNQYHYDTITKINGSEYMDRFHACFKNVYLSHKLQIRKPHSSGFSEILKREKLEHLKGLFIDDSPQHLIGANEAGLETYLMKKEDRLELLLKDLL
ncbi:MAG: HAD hydrolase-like protein [Flavobacteriales bacterium]|jgi:putative hydrolase of the HAD superfamily|nr:HAD hydrolase-like protein [Flavobacteriales bacterium]